MGRLTYCSLCGQYHDNSSTACGGSWGGATAGVTSVPSYKPQGWICPRCEKVHAPFVAACDCTPPISKWQTGNTGAATHPHRESEDD